MAEALRRGFEAFGRDQDDMPVEDAEAVRRVMAELRPDWVVHCAALTDVDGCEADPVLAEAINGRGPGLIAAACREIGATMLQVSTDYVFAGDGQRPYREDDPTGPRSVYGRSKLSGEQQVLAAGLERAFVVRTAWVFGPGGKNFPAAILARARQGGPLRVVDDQRGCPTMTHDLADALLDLAASDAPGGLFHATNDGACDWHEFAEEICRQAGLEVAVERMASTELQRPAPRPAWSVLDCERLAALRGRRLPPWRDALRRYLEEESR